MKTFLAFLISVLLITSARVANAAVSSNSLIKLECPSGAEVDHPCKAVYYYGSDGKRHAFPNDKVYFTWYSDFSTVQTISSSEMAALPLGTNVTYRPGVKMVKFASLAKVYAVSRNGLLRWVASEEIARLLYGSNWNQQIHDINDTFFTNYTFGTDITSSTDFKPTTETATATSINIDKGLATATLSKLRVSGNKVQNETGQEVRLRGVNFMDAFVLEKDDLDLSGDGLPDNHFAEVATDFARVKALGANVVRQTVYPGFYRLVGGENYLATYLDRMINLAEENGLYLIISYHVIGRPGGWYADADNMLAAYPAKVHYTDVPMAVAFWDTVAARYDKREHVLFEIYNEPADVTADFTWDLWRPTGQLLIDTVRKHSDNIILGSGPYFTGDLSAVPTSPYIDSNLVYVAHTYPGSFTPEQNTDAIKVAEWERLFGFLTATYPVIISEWGFNKNGDETTKGTLDGFGRPLCNYLDQKNLSWVAFIYHPFDSEPPMLERDWVTLNEFGLFVKECLQR